MADNEYPKHVYHKDGRNQSVPSAEAHKALGNDWSDKVGDQHHEAIRRASGAVSEVITPITRTRPEKI
jgi:hypothetical protein